MYSCPACGAENVAGRQECPCGADLSLLVRLDGLADAWYNRGLEALEAGRTGEALEWLSACCAARPTDLGARVAQAKVWAQLKRWEEARESAARAAELDPTAGEVVELRKELERVPRKRSKSDGQSHRH